MPAKGTKYATIEVALQRWVVDEMTNTGKKQADIARELGINRARVHEIYNGNANTMHHLEIIVKMKMKGDFENMAKYAQTDEGLKMLKELNFKRKLTPYQRDVYNQLNEALQEQVMKDPDKALTKLKDLKS